MPEYSQNPYERLNAFIERRVFSDGAVASIRALFGIVDMPRDRPIAPTSDNAIAATSAGPAPTAIEQQALKHAILDTIERAAAYDKRVPPAKPYLSEVSLETARLMGVVSEQLGNLPPEENIEARRNHLLAALNTISAESDPNALLRAGSGTRGAQQHSGGRGLLQIDDSQTRAPQALIDALRELEKKEAAAPKANAAAEARNTQGPTESQLKEWEAVNRITGELVDKGEMRRLEEAAHDSRDAVKRTLSPLLDKKDWRYLDAVADDIMQAKDLPDMEETLRRGLSPSKDELTRNDPAPSHEDIVRRERVFERLREARALPPKTGAQEAAAAAEKAAAAALEQAGKVAKFVGPDEVRAVGLEDAKLLANGRDPNSPLGRAFREAAAEKLVKGIQERSKGPAVGESSAVVGEQTGPKKTAVEPVGLKAKASPVAGSHLKTGLPAVAGAVGAVTIAVHQAERGKELPAAFGIVNETVLPGSTTIGDNYCRATAVVWGFIAGSGAAVGGSAVAGTVASPLGPQVAIPAAVVGGGYAFHEAQALVAQKVEQRCNDLLPESVKKIADAATGKVTKFLFGETAVVQTVHKDHAAKGKGAQIQ